MTACFRLVIFLYFFFSFGLYSTIVRLYSYVSARISLACQAYFQTDFVYEKGNEKLRE